MKKKYVAFYVLLISIFTACFVVHEAGTAGRLGNRVLNEQIFPALRRFSVIVTDLKFKLRGATKPSTPVVIVKVDSESIADYGRWPWPRNTVAKLIERTFLLGARVVGLDIVFSEAEQRVPEGLRDILEAKKMGDVADRFETDPKLRMVIEKRKEQLVLGWITETSCQPLYHPAEKCQVTHPAAKTMARSMEKFEFDRTTGLSGFKLTETPIVSAPSIIANLDLFNEASTYQGFLNAFRDPDGIVRRTSLVMMLHGRPHASFPLRLAEVYSGIPASLLLSNQRYIEKLYLHEKTDELPVAASGLVEINFRGPEETFPYVSAKDVLEAELPDPGATETRSLAGEAGDNLDKLKGAVVIIGVTALALSDIAATPFDGVVAGSEVQATILDNLLSNQLMVSRSPWGLGIMLLLMTFGALVFVSLCERLEALPVLGTSAGTLGSFFLLDAKILFPQNFNWNSSFFYAEIMTLSAVIVARKYFMEENKRKFIRTAFSKYVSPAVVDTLVQDPSLLQLGGQKTTLTMLFSDIRNFTTFSETMDAKQLSEFLNEYFNLMTSILFQFNGTLDKFIGDAVMAFFGAPQADVGHARKACEAARTMQRVLAAHRSLFKEKYGVEVKIGIGINSGPVSVGNMGSDQNFNYTCIGDSVNLASRLEGASKQYGVGILTTHFTIAEIQASGDIAPPFRLVDVVQVKGKSESVQLLQILEEEASPDGLLLFEEGREFYHDREWDKAIEKFRAASEILSHDPGVPDGPCRVLIQRCEDFKVNPPEANWDGTWALDSK